MKARQQPQLIMLYNLDCPVFRETCVGLPLACLLLFWTDAVGDVEFSSALVFFFFRVPKIWPTPTPHSGPQGASGVSILAAGVERCEINLGYRCNNFSFTTVFFCASCATPAAISISAKCQFTKLEKTKRRIAVYRGIRMTYSTDCGTYSYYWCFLWVVGTPILFSVLAEARTEGAFGAAVVICTLYSAVVVGGRAKAV